MELNLDFSINRAFYGENDRKLDTVGVRGSIPRSPTISLLLKTRTKAGYDSIPAVEWVNGLPYFYTVKRPRKPSKKCEAGVKRTRRSRSPSTS